jgi:hypothetical protein
MAGLVGCVAAEEPTLRTAPSMVAGARSVSGSFGSIDWTDHPDDWRARLLSEHVFPSHGPGTLRPLGRLSAPSLHTGALPGWSLEADPHRNRLMLRYGVSF